MGVKEWTPVAVTALLLSAAFVCCLFQMRKGSAVLNLVVMFSAALTYMVMSRLMGPLVLMPGFARGTAMVCAMYPVRSVQRIAIGVMACSTLVPFVLERIHVLSPSYLFCDGQMTVIPDMCALPETATLAFLSVVPNLLTVVRTAGILRTRNALTEAEERIALQAWQFRQLAWGRSPPGWG